MEGYLAKDVHWVAMEIFGIEGLFSDLRIVRDSIPEGYYMYELRDNNDCEVCQYKTSVMVNFMGTFISKKLLPPGDGYVNEGDWGFIETPS